MSARRRTLTLLLAACALAASATPALASPVPPGPGDVVTIVEEPLPELPSRAATPTPPAVAPATVGNLATVQVLVGMQASWADNPSVLYAACDAMRSDFLRSARSSRVFELRTRTSALAFGRGVTTATCSIRFLGRPTAAALAQDLAAAQARRPTFAFSTAPDTVTGFALVAQLKRYASHRALGAMGRVTAKHVPSSTLGCAGSGVSGRTVATAGTLTATSAGAVNAARADFARLFGLPTSAVRVVSLWSPEMAKDVCAPPTALR